MKTKNELKAMIAELVTNKYTIVANDDMEYFLNMAHKIGLIVCGGALTKNGKIYYIEL